MEAIFNRDAYGRIPVLPPTTTDTTSSTVTQTPNLYNYDALSKQASELAASLMGGSVSPGTLALLNRQAAERGVGFGPSAPITNAQFLAATGQLSENLALQGGQLYNQLLASAPRTTTTSGTTVHDLAALQAILNAAPDPYAAAMANWAAMNLGQGLGLRTTSFARPGGGYSPIPPTAGRGATGLTPYTGGGFGSGTDTRWSGTPYTGDYSYTDPAWVYGWTDTPFDWSNLTDPNAGGAPIYSPPDTNISGSSLEGTDTSNYTYGLPYWNAGGGVTGLTEEQWYPPEWESEYY